MLADRAPHVEESEELRNRRDLVRLHVGRVLAEHHLVFAHPCVDQMQRALSVRARKGPAYGLAIDRNELARRRYAEMLGPRDERIAERRRVERRHHPANRIGARNPVRQFQDRLQVLVRILRERVQRVPSLALADRPDEHDQQNVDQLVAPRALYPRVRDRIEKDDHLRPLVHDPSTACPTTDGKALRTPSRRMDPQSKNKPTRAPLSEGAPALALIRE